MLTALLCRSPLPLKRISGPQVRDGDLKHIVGVVQSVNAQSGSVVVLPTSTEGLFKKGQFKDGLAFEAEQLQKWFKMGDHVKVGNFD